MISATGITVDDCGATASSKLPLPSGIDHRPWPSLTRWPSVLTVLEEALQSAAATRRIVLIVVQYVTEKLMILKKCLFLRKTDLKKMLTLSLSIQNSSLMDHEIDCGSIALVFQL